MVRVDTAGLVVVTLNFGPETCTKIVPKQRVCKVLAE
jgi:hypothetical protein